MIDEKDKTETVEEKVAPQGLQVKVGVTNEDRIIISFGVELSWVGFDKEEAIRLADTLYLAASKIENKNPSIFLPNDSKIIH